MVQITGRMKSNKFLDRTNLGLDYKIINYVSFFLSNIEYAIESVGKINTTGRVQNHFVFKCGASNLYLLFKIS